MSVQLTGVHHPLTPATLSETIAAMMNSRRLLVILALLVTSSLVVHAQHQDSNPYQRGITLLAEGKYKEAAEAFEQACKLEPNNTDAFLRLGNAYRDSEQPLKAIETYQRALKLKPKWFEALYGLGVAYGMAGFPKESVIYLKESIALKADSAGAFYNLGVAYSDLGQIAEAAQAFKKATQLNPKDADNFFNLGASYQTLNRLNEAEEAFAQALLLKPEDQQARYQIALVYLAKGDRGLATVHYLALLKSNPELAGKLRAQLFPTVLLNKRVTLSLPEAWKVQNQEDREALARVQLLVPYPATDNTPESANAAIIAKPVRAGFTIKEAGDEIYRRPFSDLKIVNDIPDGSNWRTIVWTARNGDVQYLAFDRFGVLNNLSVEFLVAFPLMKNGDPKWVEQLVKDFNAICESLKIDGTNSTSAKVHLDKLPEKKN